MDKKAVKKAMNRNSMEGDLRKDMEEFFKISNEATDKTYKDGSGKEYMEKPEKYDSRMTRAMAKDMLLYSKTSIKKFGEGIKEAENWYLLLKDLDDTIMRMADDRKAGRNVIDFKEEEAECLMKEMTRAKKERSLTKEGKRLLDTWFARVLYITKWAFVILQEEDLSQILFESSMRAYDDNGNLCMGIPEEDEKEIHILVSMIKIMLRVYLRIPEFSDKGNELVDKIEWINILAKAILAGKTGDLERILKSKEAAKDFEGCEN